MTVAPALPSAQQTTTIVIGSGFSALAVAAELNRQGIDAIMIDGFGPTQPYTAPVTGGISLAELSERSQVLRILEHYARRHRLDIRPATRAMELNCGAQKGAPGPRQWQVRTASGTLTARSVVFTRSALAQLRRLLHTMGITTATDVRIHMQALGLYLVGVGEVAIPSTAEILHQARRASQSIKSRLALPEGPLAGAFA
ncbi:FAD-binding protein [Specibacter sp. NPDC057265]|uniref:FAD-binding protein n=1 Tax=Specibacter sp. NPDC057265 TaxID=3346075 RepID=UPI00363B7E4C